MTIKGRILHLENEDNWIQHVADVLGNNHDLYSVRNPEDAAKLFLEFATEGQKIDLVIVDISMLENNPEDKRGFEFIDNLEKSGVMLGHNIIVLTAYPEVQDNQRVAFRDFDVRDVFDKGNFEDERDQFLQSVEKIVLETRE